MKFNEHESANWIASNLQSMYVDKKADAIEQSTKLNLTLEQFAAISISRDLAGSGAISFESDDEDDGKMEFYIYNVIELMYIRDAEKYRKLAVEKGEQFEIIVARAMSSVLRKWVSEVNQSE